MGVSEVIWLALALVLIVEGLLPFFAPRLWQHMVEQLIRQGERSIRGFGFFSIALGLLILWVL